jgi:outer membrane protein TolC
MQRDRLALRQAEEKQRVLSAVLARTLHLDPTVELVAQDADLVPVHLVDPDTALGPLVEQALARRPESRQTAALLAAARDAENGAAYGPLFPSIGGLAFVGGLAGGKNAELGDLGPSQDYVAVLSWRLGPGGLLDPARIRSSRARRRAAELGAVRTRDEIARQVVESLARVRSLADQITTSEQSLADAGESLRLSEQRQLFGVGAVLEHIQAQQELTRVRNDYVSIIAEYNKAQYALIRSIGGRMPE